MLALLLPQESWTLVGHEVPASPGATFALVALVLLVAGYALALGHAALRHRRYRAEGVLAPEDLTALREAVAAAERKTVGEILPVVLERSDPHPGASWLAAFVTVVLGSAALIPWLPWGHPELVLGLQLALGGLGYSCARALPGFQRLFVRESRASETAEEQALQEFHRHGLVHTQARTGVLLFVSLFEQRAIVLADEGITACVTPEQWQRTNDAVLAGIRRGSLRDGLLDGIRSAGEVLAREFPFAEGDRNEIPDRVIVRRR